jgi:hypothetical protein
MSLPVRYIIIPANALYFALPMQELPLGETEVNVTLRRELI